jgi:PAS domain S-box-containing protein
MKNTSTKGKRIKSRISGKTSSPDLSSMHLESLFKILLSKSRLHFEKYKKDVVARRVFRRMGLLAVSSITEYLALLQDDPKEADRLANDLMIGVTGFFRDPEAWDALSTELLAKLASEKGSEKPFRVWVPACSTGEEAYTIAMMLTRLAETPNGPPKIFQIFATDINEKSLHGARAGIYPLAATENVPEDYRKRFFTKRQDGVSMHINKIIRDVVVFAKQNILVDPPFSKVDCIICRNLFIYLEPDAQNKCIELFHYALNPDGYLFMGNAESVGKRYSLFKSLGNKKCRLYKRVGPSRLPGNKIPLLFPAGSHEHGALPSAFAPDDSSIHAIAQQELLRKFAPAAVVINKSYGIVYYNGPTNKYLSQPGGAPTNKLLDQAPEGLRNRLRRHCSQVIHDNKPRVMLATFPGKNKTPLQVSVSISPLSATGADGGLYVVSFEEYAASKVLEKTDVEPCGADEPIIRQLEHELSSTRDELQGNIEQLKSLNEEMHSSNEELQAANEELETSREELQSLNEELVTVNTQLQETVEAQEITKNDLNNFFTSTDIPTMFLDRNLRIKRFTPAMTRIVKFIDADIGRSFGEFTQENIGPELAIDAQEVLAKLSTVTREVECGGRWFIRSALPYRTVDDRIEGVVVTFTDITELKNAEQALRDSEERFKTIAEMLPALISLSSSEDSTIIYTNSAYNEAFGFRKGELVGRQGPDVYFDPVDRDKMIEAITAKGSVSNYRIKAKKSDGTPIWLLSSVRPINYGGKPAMLGASIDITESIKTEEALRKSEQRLKFHFENSPLAVVEWDNDFIVTQWSNEAERIFGWKKEETLGKRIDSLNIIHVDDIPIVNRTMERLTSGKENMVVSGNRNCTKSGTIIECTWYNSILLGENGKMSSVMSLVQDITDRKKAEETMRASEERYRTLFNSLIEGFCIIEMVFDANNKPVDYRFLEINEAFEEQTGLHDAQGKLMRDLAPDHEEQWFEIYGKIALTGEPAEFVNEAKALNRWFEVYAFRMGGPESRKVAICFSDITERKKAENALQEQNEISNAILNATTETLWLMDLEGNILGANETAAKRLGKTVAEVVGKNAFAITPPYVKELRQAKIREMAQTGKPVQFHDERDGIIFHHTFYPVRDALGAVKGLVIFSRDITEQKNAEDALKISEERFRTMFERHQAVMLLIEPDSGAIVDANAAAASFYGYSKERLLSLKIHDLNRMSRENVAEEMKKAVAERKTNFVFPHLLANGQVRLVEVYSSPTDVQGKKLLFSIIHDITERKKNERELKQVNRTLSAHSKSSQAMMRADDENIYLNEVCEIITEGCGYAMVWIGYAENDDGKTVRPMASAGFDEGYLQQLDITWSDTERGRGPTGTAIRTGKYSRCLNMRMDPNFAPWREEALCRGYASSLVLPLLNGNKAFGAITIYSKEPEAFAEDEVKLLSDIADDLAYGILAIRMQEARILAEETVIRERNFCNAIIQTTSGLIIVLDPEGRIELFNHACEKATGYSYHELKGKPFWDYLLLSEEKDAVKDVFNKIKDGRVNAEMEYENYWVAKDSSKRFIRWANSALKDARGKVELVIGTGIDMSDDKINREKIEELNSFLMKKTTDLLAANKELESFSYSVSHDLRGPLRSIDGFTKILWEEYGPSLDDQAKDYIGRVCASVGKMSNLIDDLLRLSRISRQEMKLTNTDLSALADAVLSDVRAADPSRAVELVVQPGLTAQTDPGLIRIALENLLGNAWKFTGKRERAKIEFGATAPDGQAVFFIRDNGAGFKVEYVNRMFTPFQRLHSEKEFPGTGIGLAITQRIIQRHGGRIWAEGSVGEGAVFYFTLGDAFKKTIEENLHE